MAVIAVVNRKGGSGKSTVAAHIASYLAHRGHEVTLGDIDRQKSLGLWLNLRSENVPRIQGWAVDDRNFTRPPAGVKHLVLDTPAGFQGLGLMKVALYADAMLLPTTPSLFDRSAASASVRELCTLPRLQLGKCRVACVGMRIDGRTKHGVDLRAWANEQGIEHLGTIKEAQIYARCMERGMSLFDLPGTRRIEELLQEWQRVVEWIDEVSTSRPEVPPVAASRLGLQRGSSLLPRRPTAMAAVPPRRAMPDAAGVGTTNIAVHTVPIQTPAFLRA